MQLKRNFAKTWESEGTNLGVQNSKLRVTGNSAPQFMSKVLIFILCDFQNYITAS